MGSYESVLTYESVLEKSIYHYSRWLSIIFWCLLHKKVNKFHEFSDDSFTLKDTTNYRKFGENKKSCFIPQKWMKKLQITLITLIIHCLFFIDIIYREILNMYREVNRNIDICLHLLSQVLPKVRGRNTMHLCTRYFSKWKQWVSQFPSTKAIPVNDTCIIIYMVNLFQKSKSCGNIRISFLVTKYFQKITRYKQKPFRP